MPHKHHAARRHRIPAVRYRVSNWRHYEASLRQRGSLTLWFTDAAIAAWRAEPRTTPGGQAIYSDMAIETVLMLRLVLHLPLRQTEGFVHSLTDLLGLAIRIPDHSTMSRRAPNLIQIERKRLPDGPVHLLIDSTGLKVFGAGEWQQEKHAVRPRQTWRKLHLLVDADTHEIVASALTANDADDASQVGPLLDQIGGSFTSFTGDGAYDAEATYRTVAERQPDDPPSVIVPPRSTAVPSRHAKTDPTQRDRHLATLGAKGRMAWQKESGYNRRALAEVMMARYKQIIGSRLWARSLPNQKAEAALAVTALNRMTQAGMPVSVRIT
jgi:Transposase DDE domain